MSNPTEKGVCDNNFLTRKDFVINVVYEYTAAHLLIFNKRQTTNTLVSTFNEKFTRRK